MYGQHTSEVDLDNCMAEMSLQDYTIHTNGHSHSNQGSALDAEDKYSRGIGSYSQGGYGVPYEGYDNPALRRIREDPPSMQRHFSDSQILMGRKVSAMGSNSPLPVSSVRRNESTFVMDISPSVVGWIIGRAGIRIKEIQAQTGCKMWVDQDVPNDQPRKIYFHGTKQNIDAAVNRVSELVQTAPILASANATSGKGLTSTIVDCPVSLVGLLIGKRGWTIKKIQQASGAQISINQSVREGLPRKIIVSGDEAAVATALHLIDEVLREKPFTIENDPRDSTMGGGQYVPQLAPPMDYVGTRDGRSDPHVYNTASHNSGQISHIYRQHAQPHSSSPPSQGMQNVAGRYSSSLRPQDPYTEYGDHSHRVSSMPQSKYEQQGVDRGNPSTYGKHHQGQSDFSYPQGYESRPQQRHFEDVRSMSIIRNRDIEGDERWLGSRESHSSLSGDNRISRPSEPSLLSFHLKQQYHRSVQQQGPPVGYPQRHQDSTSAYCTSNSSSLELGTGFSPIEHRNSDPLVHTFDIPHQQKKQQQSSSPSQQLASSPASTGSLRVYGSAGDQGLGPDSSDPVFDPQGQLQHPPHVNVPFLNDTYGGRMDHFQPLYSHLKGERPAPGIPVSTELSTAADHNRAPSHYDVNMYNNHFSGSEHRMFDQQLEPGISDLSTSSQQIASAGQNDALSQPVGTGVSSSNFECDQLQQPRYLPPDLSTTEDVE